MMDYITSSDTRIFVCSVAITVIIALLIFLLFYESYLVAKKEIARETGEFIKQHLQDKVSDSQIEELMEQYEDFVGVPKYIM